MSVRLLIALLFPAVLSAQFHLTVRTGVVAHGGHARDASDPDAPTFGPGTTADGAIAIGVDRGAWRIALVAGRETPDLVLLGQTSGIITRDALSAWHGGLEVGHRVVGPAGAPAIHLLAGVGVTRWSFPGFEDPARNRLGGWLALDGALPLAKHFDGVLRLELAGSPSLFESTDLPEGFEPARAHRVGASLGLRWRR